MNTHFRPSHLDEHTLSPYTVRQMTTEGQVVSERQVAAQSYSAALREMGKVSEEAQRIEVFNSEGEKAGEIGADHWRLKRRSKN